LDLMLSLVILLCVITFVWSLQLRRSAAEATEG
jgi:hypothetical protein